MKRLSKGKRAHLVRVVSEAVARERANEAALRVALERVYRAPPSTWDIGFSRDNALLRILRREARA